jgi:hypothetical protein
MELWHAEKSERIFVAIFFMGIVSASENGQEIGRDEIPLKFGASGAT